MNFFFRLFHRCGSRLFHGRGFRRFGGVNFHTIFLVFLRCTFRGFSWSRRFTSSSRGAIGLFSSSGRSFFFFLHRRGRGLWNDFRLFRVHLGDFLVHLLQSLNRRLVRFEHHVDFHAIVFTSKQRFFVLVLSHGFKRVIFGPRGHRDPIVVQYFFAQRRSGARVHFRKVLRQQTVGRTTSFARR